MIPERAGVRGGGGESGWGDDAGPVGSEGSSFESRLVRGDLAVPAVLPGSS